MRKEVKFEDTVFEYYCDLCGKEQKDESWGYGGFASASEHLERCWKCGKEVCHKCRESISELGVFCSSCVKENSDIIAAAKENRQTYGSRIDDLWKQLKQRKEKAQ